VVVRAALRPPPESGRIEPMSRRLDSRAGGLSPEAVLAGFGALALVTAIAGIAGPLGGACLIEMAGSAFGTALGFNSKRPWIGSLIGTAVALPLARTMYLLIGASGC
jgi:hypothetical protein